MVIAELNRQGLLLQRTFEGHFPGFRVIPRTREVRVPAIVRDVDRRIIDQSQLLRLLKPGEDPSHIANGNSSRIEIATMHIMGLLDYIDGYSLADTLETHGERVRRKRLLLEENEELYFTYKRTNQLSVNNITRVANAFEFLPEILQNRRLAADFEMSYAEIFMLVKGKVPYDEMSLEGKLATVRRIIDISMEGLNALSQGLPANDDFISIT